MTIRGLLEKNAALLERMGYELENFGETAFVIRGVPADIDAAAALVGRAGGAVAEVQSYLDDSYLIAPCNGEVVELFAKVGDLIGTGSPVVSILDMDDSWFFFAVREDRLSDVSVGSTVQVRIPALGDQTYSGTVRRVQAMASYATWRATKTNGQYDVKSFDVKVVPIEHIEGLKPGMTAIMVK
jgi:HlyD family secretion protein